MTQIIANYRDLQDRIAAWLNRTDPGLVEEIPTFIYLAERMIFRRYRAPNNEKTISFDMRDIPDTAEPTQLAVTDEIPVPDDYLEMLTFESNGRPLQRISITNLQTRQQATSPINQQLTTGNAVQAIPQLFARIRNTFFLWPPPQGDTLVEMLYYCDLSGQLVDDEDTNDVLRTAPDLYLFGALLEAQPFLKPEAGEANLINIWSARYQEAFELIETQRDDAEFSGSVTEVQSSFSGSSRVRSGAVEGLLIGVQ